MKTVIIIGSSIAGMTTAKVMSNYVDQVYILERNIISEIKQPTARKGVPQAKHVHVLLSKGCEVIEEVFPETRERLDELDAFEVDLGADMRWYQNNQWKSPEKSGITSASQRRPTLDFVVYNQLKEVENISILEGVNVKDIIYDKSTNSVKGLRYQIGKSDRMKELYSDLVIDCSGRGSKTPRWFVKHGIGEVEIEEVPINLRYTSRYYELPDDIENFQNIYVGAHAPHTSRQGLMMRAEDRVIVTLVGILGDFAPSDELGFLEFAKSMDHPAIYKMIRHLKPASDFMTFNYPASRRKHFNKMKNFPDGYLVMGDAYTSFNPVYGQGMTSATLQAYAIKKVLQKGGVEVEKLYQKFYKESFETIDTAWTFATAEDLRYPVEAKRPLALKVLHPFSQMVIETSHNPKVNHQFLKVINFEKGMLSLFSPKFLYQVIKTKLFGKNTLAPQIETELDKMENMLIQSKKKRKLTQLQTV